MLMLNKETAHHHSDRQGGCLLVLCMDELNNVYVPAVTAQTEDTIHRRQQYGEYHRQHRNIRCPADLLPQIGLSASVVVLSV